MAKYFPVKLIQCTMVLVFMPFLALAQSYDLSGTIRTLNHRWTGNPIATAKIDIDSGKYMAFTDSAGQYLVKNVPTGTHSIRFSKIGYRGFLETISLTKNAIFNVSLPDTMQTISIGTDTLQVKEIKELFRSNGYDLENTSFWIRDSLTIPPVFLSQANYLDSNTYRDSIGSFTADWHDAKKGSMEHILQRKLFLPNTDSVYTRTHNGYIIRCNSNNNTTGVLDNSANIPYIVLAISKLTTSNGNTMMHEVGRAENYQTVSSRSSIMNANSEGHPMNLTDYVLYAFKLNFGDAMRRGEQNVKIRNIVDYFQSQTTQAPILSLPLKNAKNVPLPINLSWNNRFTADHYKLQISQDSAFQSSALDTSVQRIDASFLGKTDTRYFARVRSSNSAGTSNWSTSVSFVTVPPQPYPTPLHSPQNNALHQPLSVALIWQKSAYADSFEVRLANDALLTNVINNSFISSVDTSFIVSGVQLNHTYYWSVRGWNYTGAGIWTEIRSFTTIEPPKPVVSPQSIIFSDVAVGSMDSAAITLQDSSFNPLTVTALKFKTPLFSFDKTAPFIVPANDSVRIMVKFTPSQFGAFTDTLIIQSDSTIPLVKIQVSGKSPFPSLKMSVDSLFFGFTRNDTSALKPFSMKNLSINPLRVDSLWVSTKYFTVPSFLAVNTAKTGDSIIASIQFFPVRNVASYTDTLLIYNNSAVSPMKVRVVGGSTIPTMSIFNTYLDFKNVGVSKSDSIHTALYSRSKNRTYIDSAVYKEKAFKVKFIPSLPVSIGTYDLILKGDSVSVNVQFTPDSAKTYSDTLYIYSQTIQPVMKIYMTGVGQPLTSVAQVDAMPLVYSIAQNFPNPFNPATTIRYGLPASSRVSLKIYNVLGQQIADLVNTEQSAGWYETTWNANVSSGLYFYRIDAVNTTYPNKYFTEMKKMLLLK